MLVVVPAIGMNRQTSNDSCRCFVEQETLSVEITPLLNPQSDIAFYDYNTIPASSNTGLEVSDQSRIYLYENTLTGDLSLITNHDRPNDGDGGSAIFSFSGLPFGSFYSVLDDPGGDSYFMSPPNATADWIWFACCTDGSAIRLGENCDFDIRITPSFGFNDGGTITSLVVLSGDISNPDVIALPSLSDTVKIRCTSCLPICDQRTQGFWRRVCKKEHPEESNGVDPYVDEVVNLGSPIFDDFDATDICDLMEVSPPENDPCVKAMRQFMALLLNIASGRLTTCQDLTDGRTVEDAIDEIKDLLITGTEDDCKDAQALAASINEGTALVPCNSIPSSPAQIIRPSPFKTSPVLPIGTSPSLATNSPNPFHRTTTIHYTIPGIRNQESGISEQISVRLMVFDVMGRLVETLVDERQEPGLYQLPISSNQLRGSGIYFFRLQAGQFSLTEKLILLH